MLLFQSVCSLGLVLLGFISFEGLRLGSARIYTRLMASRRISLLFVMGVLSVVGRSCWRSVGCLFRIRSVIIACKCRLPFARWLFALGSRRRPPRRKNRPKWCTWLVLWPIYSFKALPITHISSYFSMPRISTHHYKPDYSSQASWSKWLTS